jgi:ribose-phosphate pyrophosphokinase
MGAGDLALFTLNATRPLAQRIADRLGVALGAHEEREFDDGEHKARPLESVRGKDVFLVQSLYADATQSVNDKLCRMIFLAAALRDAGAARRTLILPYLCYARKERRTQTRDPVTSRYVAMLIESAGVDAVVALDVHSLAAFQNAYRCRTEHISAQGLFVEHYARRFTSQAIVVVAPDAGGIKRADRFRLALESALSRQIPLATMEKRRALGVLSGEHLAGEVDGAAAIIVDDMIGTGSTIARAAAACRRSGAASVHAAATHGLFLPGSAGHLDGAGLATIVVTDSVPPFRLAGMPLRDKVVLLETAALLADVVRCLHTDGSLVDLVPP